MIRFWRYLKWSHTEKRLFWIAAYWLCRSKITIARGPFKKIKPMLGQVTQSRSSLDYEAQQLKLMRLSLFRAESLMPFHCQCLVMAIAAQKICRELKLPATLVLGVNKKDQNLAAHAWICLGDEVVVGQTEQSYTAVQQFSCLTPTH